MEINSSDRFAWFSRGKILANFNKLEESLYCFDRAISLKADYYEAWSEKGEVLELLGRLQEADDCFNQALGAFCGDIGAALEDDLGILATPKDGSPGSAYNQACFHAIQGNIQQAVTYLAQAISYNPNKYRAMASQDTDFDSIVNADEFQVLLLSAVSCPIIG